MGKRIISQRRGRGSTTYRAPSFKFPGKAKFGLFEKDDCVTGQIIKVFHSRAHSAPLMKVAFANGVTTLLPAFLGSYEGQPFAIDMREKVESITPGNAYMLKNIPDGTFVYHVEMIPGDGGKLARGAGNKVLVVSQIGDMTKLLLPSKKEKLVKGSCRAIIGIAGGSGRKDKPFVKAGNKFHEMKKKNILYPRTSGSRMAAHDHPYGNTRSLHIGQPTIAPKNAPPGQKVGMIRPRKTGGRKK